MAEETRLREINESLRILEEKMQVLTIECHSQIEGRIHQVTEEYNIKIKVLAKQLDEIQLEEK